MNIFKTLTILQLLIVNVSLVNATGDILIDKFNINEEIAKKTSGSTDCCSIENLNINEELSKMDSKNKVNTDLKNDDDDEKYNIGWQKKYTGLNNNKNKRFKYINNDIGHEIDNIEYEELDNTKSSSNSNTEIENSLQENQNEDCDLTNHYMRRRKSTLYNIEYNEECSELKQNLLSNSDNNIFSEETYNSDNDLNFEEHDNIENESSKFRMRFKTVSDDDEYDGLKYNSSYKITCNTGDNKESKFSSTETLSKRTFIGNLWRNFKQKLFSIKNCVQ